MRCHILSVMRGLDPRIHDERQHTRALHTILLVAIRDELQRMMSL
jgi:hypothetical protein